MTDREEVGILAREELEKERREAAREASRRHRCRRMEAACCPQRAERAIAQCAAILCQLVVVSGLSIGVSVEEERVTR